MTIQILPRPVWGPFPHYRDTGDVRPTPEAAYHDASEWLRGYCAADIGNGGVVLGVSARDGGYVGVINYGRRP